MLDKTISQFNATGIASLRWLISNIKWKKKKMKKMKKKKTVCSYHCHTKSYRKKMTGESF